MDMYCTSCGDALHEGDDFCQNCGQRSAPPSPTETASGQEVLAILPKAQFCKGFLGFGSSMSVLVITRQALLIAKMPDAMEAQIDGLEDELQELRGNGMDDHELIKAQDFSHAPWQIFARRPLEESLKPDGRLLEMSSIIKAEVAMHEGWSDDTLRIYLPGETLKFVLWWPLGEIALQALRLALGDKVKDVS
jgi:hypothetical protein